MTYIIGVMGRVLLMLASLKKPQICKCYLLYEQFLTVVDFCMAYTAFEAQTLIMVFMSILDIISFHQDLLFSLSVVTLSQVAVTMVWHQIERGYIDILGFFLQQSGLVAVLLTYHFGVKLLLNRHAKLYLELKRCGQLQECNQNLLDEFGEALIVLDKESHQILFTNRVEEKFIHGEQSKNSENHGHNFIDEKLFALCPDNLFTRQPVDPIRTIQTI